MNKYLIYSIKQVYCYTLATTVFSDGYRYIYQVIAATLLSNTWAKEHLYALCQTAPIVFHTEDSEWCLPHSSFAGCI